MSIKLMSQIWEKDLNHSQQSILLAMADFADDNGDHCYPSVARLAWKSGYSYRQTAEILKGLVKDGFIKVVKPATNRTQAEYKICAFSMKDKPPFDPKTAKFGVEEISTQEDENKSRVEEISTPNAPDLHPRVEEISTDPLDNHYLNISIVADEPQQPISSLDAQQLEPVGNSEQQPDAECNKRSGKRGKRSKPDSDVAQDAEQPDHRQMWEAIFYITHLHKEFKLSTKEMDMAIGKAAKKLRDLGYNIDDLRNWYRNIWSKEFPGLQNGQVQRATIGQICGGVGRIRNCTAPESLSGPSTPTAPAAVGASVYKASPELER